MAYSRIEMEISDIDWFVRINGRCIHGASGGGILPEVIINNKHVNEEIGDMVAENKYMLPMSQIEINPNLKSFLNLEDKKEDIRSLLENLNIKFEDPIDTYIREIYVTSYVEYARKGFWSFDKTYTNIFEDGYYHLVAWPSKRKLHKKLFESADFFDFNSKKRNRFPHNKPINIVEIINTLSLPNNCLHDSSFASNL